MLYILYIYKNLKFYMLNSRFDAAPTICSLHWSYKHDYPRRNENNVGKRPEDSKTRCVIVNLTSSSTSSNAATIIKMYSRCEMSVLFTQQTN